MNWEKFFTTSDHEGNISIRAFWLVLILSLSSTFCAGYFVAVEPGNAVAFGWMAIVSFIFSYVKRPRRLRWVHMRRRRKK